MATFEAIAPVVGAQAVGIARAAYEYALDYAKERKAFGRPIIENQAHRLQARRHEDADRRRAAARVAGRVDGPHRQAVRGRRGLDVEALRRARPRSGSPSRPSRSSAATATSASYPVERWHRDAKIYTIFEGTSEIQRLIIARAISGVHIQ